MSSALDAYNILGCWGSAPASRRWGERRFIKPRSRWHRVASKRSALEVSAAYLARAMETGERRPMALLSCARPMASSIIVWRAAPTGDQIRRRLRAVARRVTFGVWRRKGWRGKSGWRLGAVAWRWRGKAKYGDDASEMIIARVQ